MINSALYGITGLTTNSSHDDVVSAVQEIQQANYPDQINGLTSLVSDLNEQVQLAQAASQQAISATTNITNTTTVSSGTISSFSINYITPSLVLNLSNPAATTATTISVSGISTTANTAWCSIQIDSVATSSQANLYAGTSAIQVPVGRGVNPVPGNIDNSSYTVCAAVPVSGQSLTYSITGPSGTLFTTVQIFVYGWS